jgi:hypothetical protein
MKNFPQKVTDPYIFEERKELVKRLIYEIDKSGQFPLPGTLQFNDSYIFTPKNLTAAAFVACTEPIEEMPLYVNTEDAYLKSVVLWRLSIAK